MTKCAQCGDDESLLNRYDVCPGCVDKALTYKAPADPVANTMTPSLRKAVIRKLLAGGSVRAIAVAEGAPTIEVKRLKRSIQEVINI